MRLPTSNIPPATRSAVRFVIVGMTGVGIQYGIYYAFLMLLALWMKDSPHYVSLAFRLGFILEMISNYLLQAYYVFENKPNWKNAGGFLFSRALNYFVQMGFLYGLMWFGMNEKVGGISAILLAGVVNYFVLKIFFRKKKEALGANDWKPLEYYLTQEQRLVESVKEPIFFSWRVRPTVIYGRHQIASQELDEAYCAAKHIRVVQRPSGGGCVYADEGNVMLSYISPSTHSKEVFEYFINRVAKCLQAMGYEAVTTEHNDILVGGRKVSGSASFAAPTGTIVHCTMMYDVNTDELSRALTPSQDKLDKHAVSSVRQRVTNLKQIVDWGDTEHFRMVLDNKWQDLDEA